MSEYWNHNVHYHPVVLDAVPDGCGAALDVGCGDGLLVRRLAGRAQVVTGVDRSAQMVELARSRSAGVAAARFVEADVTRLEPVGPLAVGGYDFVCSVAMIHHVDFAEGLAAMRRLLAPGGRLVVVGLARNRTPWDWVVSGAGVPAHRWHAWRHGRGDKPPAVPIEDPRMSWGQVRAEAERLLPGCRWRRHLLWRYSLVWDKPA